MYLYFDKLKCLRKRNPQKRYTKSELYVLCLEDLNADDWEVEEVPFIGGIRVRHGDIK